MEKTSTGKIIQSVQRAIDILNCFDDLNTALTLGQISERLALNKSTVHGILNTLHCNDFVRQIPTGQYMLGPAMLGRHHQEGEVRRKVLLECARDTMIHIANEYHVNCSLFVLDVDELVIVKRFLPEHAMYTVNCSADSYINPLYCTASGKILLSTMSSSELDTYLKNHELIAHTANTITTSVNTNRQTGEVTVGRTVSSWSGDEFEFEGAGYEINPTMVSIYEKLNETYNHANN